MRQRGVVLLPWVLGLTACGGVSAPAPATPTPRPLPNIVFILADDMGWADVGAYQRVIGGAPPAVPTPNLDRLAREGVRFMDAHAPAAVCAPSRFSLLTGSYPYRSLQWGTWDPLWPSAFEYGGNHRTIGQTLRAAGYDTAFVGKMHLGGDFYRADGTIERADWARVDFNRPFRGLRAHGFDYTFVSPDGIWGPMYLYFENDRWVGVGDLTGSVPGLPALPPSRVVPLPRGPAGQGVIGRAGYGDSNWDSTYAGPVLLEKALTFVDDHRRQHPDRPFLLYYASEAIHVPQTPPRELAPGVPIRGATGLGDRADMVFELDAQVGQLLAKLDETGVAGNTLVFFTSDNGGQDKWAGSQHSTGPLRGAKGTIWEGGHRVPFIVRWGDPARGRSPLVADSESWQPVLVQDWVATVHDLVGQAIPADQVADSVSLLPVLLRTRPADLPLRDHLILQAGGEGEAPEGMVFARAVRHGDWVLLFDDGGRPVELYDLRTDLGQGDNRIADPAQVGRIAELTTYLRAYGSSQSPRTAAAVDYSNRAQRTPLPPGW